VTVGRLRLGVGVWLIAGLTVGCSLVGRAIHAGTPARSADPSFTEAAHRVCIENWQLGPADAVPVLQDQREPDAALVLLATDEWNGACLLRRVGDEFIQEAGAGGDSFVRGARLAIEMWSPIDNGGMVTGRIAAPVQRVEVFLSDGTVLEASTNGNYFAAWWRDGGDVIVVVGVDTNGNEVERDTR
jgi:hypothetical protein